MEEPYHIPLTLLSVLQHNKVVSLSLYSFLLINSEDYPTHGSFLGSTTIGQDSESH